MNSLGQASGQVRCAFRDAAEWFSAVADQAGDSLDQEALGVWTVRDLIGHTSRALTTVESYLVPDLPPVEVPTAVDYFLRALQADRAQIAQRGKEAGLALGGNPAAAVAEATGRVAQLVDSLENHARFSTPAGMMVLTEYLPTRTFELTVHTCDLARALGFPGNVPPSAASAALRIGAELGAARGLAAPLLLAMTGRTALPGEFSIL